MLAEIAAGNDPAAGWRSHRQDPFSHQRLPSTIANRLIFWNTQVECRDYGWTVKGMSREVPNSRGLTASGIS